MIINGILVQTDEEFETVTQGLDVSSKTALYNLFHNIETTPQQIDQVKKIIEDATTFGNTLMTEFAAQNVMMGITQDGMTGTVRKALSEVISCLVTGSLYDAIHEIKLIPVEKKDSKYLTNDRLTVFVNKIEDYLQIPHTVVV